ncbi:zf-HC2 domain-containing protein [Pseudonocardia sp. CA-107938]|uniref:zf-HC2 domain-containing protein n=1 Tax=Pseudonocardia sp. CA-107938 TaxID=3240021 RepID=UPI003D950AEE
MGCLEFRNAISARLDGEEQPSESAALDAHLATCADCAEYADRAARITRLTRTRVAEPGPDLVAAVLAAAPPPPRRRLRAFPVRMALGGVGVGQFGLAISGIVVAGHHADMDAAQLAGAGIAHLTHESAAWNLALAIGFLWAATGSTRPSGLVPILSGFVGVLTVLSVLDAIRGGVDPTRLMSHGLVVLGLVLLVLLQRATRGGGGSGLRSSEGLAGWGTDARPGRGGGSSATGGLAPTGRDLAA